REHTKALLEGSAAATTFVNAAINGAVDGRVFNSARDGKIFCSISAGKSRYTSGSHVDCKNFSVTIGVGKTSPVVHGELTSAIFAEGVSGCYKSFNSFLTDDVDGKGDSRCLGGGVFARLDGNGSENGHFYGEGSAHGGKIKHDFSSDDMVDFMGTRTEYSSKSTYFGIHGGGGYIRKIGHGVLLDTYAKYVWARKNGKDIILSTGETVDFKNVDSKRLLSGLKLSRPIGSSTAAYIGGACHYEFDGKVNGSIAGLDIDTPSLRGASAMIELGISGNYNSFSFDLGTHGFLGKRRGIDAFFDIKRTF
ncbi:MAG: autotransporter domain-containing protein, partial [Puniceicoccales bacterium]|nr:autotransporter domain-containing protein [Puniceicoccales bacterium]